MFAVSNLINAVAMVISWALTLYMWILIARSILSWVNPDPYNPIVKFLYSVTEPVLYPIRRRIPYLGGLDLSPLILIMAILFLQVFLVKTLQDLAFALTRSSGGLGF
ncbi:Cell division integral membrane protein, YggT and half-length relatives [hydrothermal vent metagenome]|uniref:Cell division integral membrane protein, YggT and half-length relatives n=1 Tax=hydrothermal vent metagenome TaxID=652676 RepID=A0A3B0QR65_9ZZZZ